MANFLFWNLNKKQLIEQVVTLCHNHDVDVLILAESVLNSVDLLESLNRGKSNKYRLPFNPSEKLSFFIRYPDKYFRSIQDEGGIAVRWLKPPIGLDMLIIAVHLPSKLHTKEIDQALFCTRLRQIIDKAEKKVQHSRTVLIGDLNMNPFEPGVVAAEGLHAVMDKKIAYNISRTVQGEARKYFYNPMWSLMGDNSAGPPGTYYYKDSSNVSYFWNSFDQILIRPDLIRMFPEDQLHVISSVADQNLLNKNGIPDKKAGSDHLPVLFSVEIESEV